MTIVAHTVLRVQRAKPSLMGATVRCSTIIGPRTILLGDAAHGVQPNMGQGANSALESAHVFSEVRADS